jgi:integrase
MGVNFTPLNLWARDKYHLGADHNTAWIGESISRGNNNLKTKTGKARTIQISPTLQAALMLRYQQLQPKPNDLVFPAIKGGAIDDNRFRARCWKTILEICNIEYRKPYAIGHSAISPALAKLREPSTSQISPPSGYGCSSFWCSSP